RVSHVPAPDRLQSKLILSRKGLRSWIESDGGTSFFQRSLVDRAMEERGMGNVDIALKSLQIVAALIVVKGADLMRRQLGEQPIRKRRRLGLRPHVGPDDAAGLARRIGDVTDRLAEIR